ncbi:tryptophan-rich sensory protein [Microbacterium sp. C7(2022)]|uniref:tryptophan-rich sensory protein n=1 Tax=Microbacterium sp. C7(2022) TaxID=2992759 RepID=UPI00237B08BC|nr:tryptophan-rich sensory protein [Microbacterium sp. C7(2022)]MDE0545244.1 tryptophan-rich sensory protein [Microbacterium sp. C7(2022)]
MDSSAKDLTRQILVISAACFMIIAALVGTGALGGTPVQDLQDGALAADATYLAPATSAFSIWSAVYVGLLVYTVWQALPSQRANERQRALGGLIAITMVLNGIWLVLAQLTTLILTVIGIFVLLIALALTLRKAVVVSPSQGWIDRILIDGVTGLHLGWVTLASVANLTAWLTQIGPAEWENAAEVLGVTVLVAVAAIGVTLSWATARLAPALALTWGLSWLAVARLTDQPRSDVIGYAAAAVAAVILVAGIVFTVRGLRAGVTQNRSAAQTPATA